MRIILTLIAIFTISIIFTSCQTDLKDITSRSGEKVNSSAFPTIYVAKDGALSFNGEKFAAKDLLSKLESQGINNNDVIHLKIETKTKHKDFMPVLDQLVPQLLNNP